MGFSLNLGGSKGKESSTSSTNTTTTVKRFDEASKQVLDNLMNALASQLPASGAQFSRENAITDANTLVANIFDQYKTVALPQIAMGMQGAGVYNATAGQNLANEAFGKATSNAAQAVMENISKYAGLQQQEKTLTLSGLLQALGMQKEAFSTSNEVSTGTTSGKASGMKFGLGGNIG